MKLYVPSLLLPSLLAWLLIASSCFCQQQQRQEISSNNNDDGGKDYDLIAAAFIGNGGTSSEEKADAAAEQQAAAAAEGIAMRRYNLSNVFEFKTYVQMYKRHYKSPAEWVNRARWFLVRASKVFIQSIKYAHRQASKYFALNSMSDRTPEERRASYGFIPRREPSAKTPKQQPVPSAESVGGRRRRKRDTNGLEERLLTADDLMRDPENPASNGQAADGTDDQVYLDYRNTGCMANIKDQGTCGSCYIFSTIAVYEYHHCRQAGKLVEFSEQYPVDCGLKYGLNGCAGGRPERVGEFVGNFGLEQKDYYGYKAENRTCPYDIQAEYDSMGRTRVTKDSSVINFAAIHLDDEMIQYLLEDKGPLSFSIRCNDEFADYGGGIDKLGDYQSEGGHAMVLIGHGRQDGRDYWLIRNSHGLDWGEQGHYKLDKESNKDQFMEIDMIQPKFEPNPRHDVTKVKKSLYNNASLREKLISWVNPFGGV